MAPQAKIEFTILKLTFVPFVHPHMPIIIFKRKKRSPDASTSRVGDWFDRIMSKEISQVPHNLKMRFSQWDVASGNINLFMLNGKRFDKILVIFGEETVNWVYYHATCGPRIEGWSKHLPISYCSCCFYSQYLKVMEAVKGCTLKEIEKCIRG